MAIISPEKAAASGILSPELHAILQATNISDEVVSKFEKEKILSVQDAREVFSAWTLGDLKDMTGLTALQITQLKKALTPAAAAPLPDVLLN